MQRIGEEVGFTLDKRRFRANIYADLTPMADFAENAFVGRKHCWSPLPCCWKIFVPGTRRRILFASRFDKTTPARGSRPRQINRLGLER